ncbi:MAG: hypothetical protein H6718_29270 [Polyangiaceae bacterium]|nr:hypothetical protein [Myxococcales bacterium]MCB9589541.1 hypothetical protein [Polyangiaceae bacterium]MCB9609169.1 hypothetical protein [Polyangiaceae bacterium]
MKRIALATGLLLSLSVFVGCSSDDPAEESGTCRIKSVSADPSFRADILPIFQGSCTFSDTCHGDTKRSQQNLYLGAPLPNEAKGIPEMTNQEISDMLAGFIGRASETAPAVNLVTASDANASFLMYKVDGTQNDQGFQCVNDDGDPDCGESMPDTLGSLLCDNERETIRNWINMGAKDN